MPTIRLDAREFPKRLLLQGANPDAHGPGSSNKVQIVASTI
jgi:hypothetical protein